MSDTVGVDTKRDDLMRDLALPMLLFAALGAMTWAVRGTAGASAMNAHIAPGLAWGAAWWYLARDPAGRQSRRYASGWVLFALTFGFALAGNRGWVQWSHFFEGRLGTNYRRGEWVPISRSFGFVWLFVAGSAWAGLPACLLAWCGEGRPLRAWEWTLRIACGLGGGYLAWRLLAGFPEVFLPKYATIGAKYHDFQANPDLARLYRDNGAALRHAGYCLGFLFFEAARRDWKNVALISTVGLLNGLGWALCQNWKWAAQVWPDAHFNFWRCWECCGGISIGIAFGVAYYLVNRRETDEAKAAQARRIGYADPRLTWLLASGLLLLVGCTRFWPEARDLRQSPAGLAQIDSRLWGSVCLVSGAACVLAALVPRLLAGEAGKQNGRRWQRLKSLDDWTGIGLMLVLAWFNHNEIAAGFGDGVRQTSRASLLGPGNIYFYIVVASCLVSAGFRAGKSILRGGLPSSTGSTMQEEAAQPELRLTKPRAFFANEGGHALSLDWLATYLTLTVILISAVGVHLTSWWNAPIWFGLAGAAYGIGSLLLTVRQNHAVFAREPGDDEAVRQGEGLVGDPNLERWGLFVGLLYGLGLSLRKTLKGGAEVYLGNETYWDRVAWNWVALAMLVCMLAGMVWLLSKRLPMNFRGNRFRHATSIIWLVLLAENVVAQVVTGPVFGPRASWNDFLFNILYLVLFALTAVIVYHFQFIKSRCMPTGAVDRCSSY